MGAEKKSRVHSAHYAARAMDVLEAVGREHRGIHLSQLSRALDINKSSLHRVLQALMQRGYVEQCGAGGVYRLGMASYIASQNFLANMDLLRIAKPILEDLVRVCNETAYLVLPTDGNVHFFESVESTHAVNVKPLKGLSFPGVDCAIDHLFQAFASLDNPDVDSAGQTGSLAQVREAGYSADIDCLGAGIASVAVPLIGACRSVVGALAFVGPDFRLTEEKVADEMLAPLLKAGYEVSARLGYFNFQVA